ncbi:type I polyketide synthase [Aspergillus saccharolyticus JOP 1030-1]|uniref:Iterative type I polyketide synthase n=1 Tax=Aspergillus saccharolyticus JOP 1030-1 TaxID=1450539 RepID=A0A318ZEE7_9EURO|nr:iterative type I polyketide synthase [Aspergillus saccharolyticus JOP 1030-1]PYH45916.1 iterative type I polyketide synthase [Aspergillus saccharolyticus JOP 1030-1]
MEVQAAQHHKPLAIIGLAAKYAQDAKDVNSFWDFLVAAREATTSFPEDRFNIKGYYHPDPEHAGTTHTQAAQFLSEDPNSFDAAFFSVSKTEAESLDPQQRLVMENVYHALENAGLPMHKVVSSNTAVFVGGFNHDHRDRLSTDLDIALKHKPTGSEVSMISGRVSWFYDLKGPSLTIETACSSSMVALHLAARSLHAQESDMAIVSGANVYSSPHHVLAFSYSGFLGAEGKCFTFDHRANGYSRGEGVGTLIVKDLEKALSDGDTIRSVILATALDHDGRTPGLTYPSGDAQVRLIQSAYQSCGLNPAETSFVEAHGTGTSAGDPIEVKSLAQAFQTPQRGQPLYVGAVKSNIGHLEGSSGIAGILKTVLILEAGLIPPNVNFEKVNPQIKHDEWNIRFPLQVTPWPGTGARRASVNCFGLSGTNAHCILEDAYGYFKRMGLSGHHNTRSIASPPYQHEPESTENRLGQALYDKEKQKITSNLKLLLFSGFDEEAPARVASQLSSHMETRAEDDGGALLDIAYTLSERRSRFRWNSYMLATSCEDFKAQVAQGRGLSQSRGGQTPPRIGFVFTGQGAVDPRMPEQLLQYPIFQDSIAAASAYLTLQNCPFAFRDRIFSTSEHPDTENSEISHICCTIIQVALVDLLASWGIRPSCVVGHSSGEIAAAYCAGEISREVAWNAAYHRRLLNSKIQGIPKGAMLAVGLESAALLSYVEEVRRRLPGELVVACYNSPQNHTVSGDENLVLVLEQMLEKDSVFSRRLRAPNAYHSCRMKNIVDEYEAALENDSAEPGYQTPLEHRIRMFSSTTGDEVTRSSLTKSFWAQSVVSTVKFSQALERMCFEDGRSTVDELIEIGPHCALQSAIKETLAGKESIACRMTLSRSDPSTRTLLDTVGHLAVAGANVNLFEVNTSSQSPDRKPKLIVNLPPYPFNHAERSLYESRLSRALRFRQRGRHELLGTPNPDSNDLRQSWKHYLRVSENPWLRDHKIADRIVFPGVGYLVMAIEAMRQNGSGNSPAGYRFRDVNLKTMLVVPDDKHGIEVCFFMYLVNESNLSTSAVWNRFSVSSYNFELDQWVEHCTGSIAGDPAILPNPVTAGREAAILQETWIETQQQASACRIPVDTSQFYDNLCSAGIQFGSLFRNLSSVKKGGTVAGVISGKITIPDIASNMPRKFIHQHLIHPATFDNALHAGFAAVSALSDTVAQKNGLVPSFIARAWVSASIPDQGTLECYARACPVAHSAYSIDTQVWDAQNRNGALSLRGVRFSPFQFQTTGRTENHLCCSMQWNNDANFIANASMVLPREEHMSYDGQKIRFSELQLAAALLASNTVLELEGYHFPPTIPHHYLQCREYLNKLVADAAQGLVPGISIDEWQKYVQDSEMRSRLFVRVAARDTAGELLLRMGTNLCSILKQECDPLHLMFGQDEIMTRFYEMTIETGPIPASLEQVMHTFRYTYSGLRILEIGAGTGAFTHSILRYLCPVENDREPYENCVAQYDYTDLSPSFFEKAKSRLADWDEMLQFKVLNISVDPLSQGFTRESYDMVIASNVLHATPDLTQTVKYARSLLKPGGKIVLLEGCRQDILHINVIFGVLIGWWLATEPLRKWCPYVPVEEWQEILLQSSFSGIDVDIPSSRYPEFKENSLMVSTAVAPAGSSNKHQVIIITHETQSGEVAKALHEYLRSKGINSCAVETLQSLSDKDLSDVICISLLELHHPVLHEMDEVCFDHIKHLMTSCDRIQWVTCMEDPMHSLAVGLIRTIRWERASERLNLVTLAVDIAANLTEDIVTGIAQVFVHQYLTEGRAGVRHRNAEYRLHGSQVQTNRIVKSTEVTGLINARGSCSKVLSTEWKSLKWPAKLSIASTGTLDGLRWVSDTDLLPPLGPTEVEIRVCAVGINFKDLLTVFGEVPHDSIGCEAAGVITRVGAAVCSRLQIRDRVVYHEDPAHAGTFRTIGRAEQDFVVRIPHGRSFEEAASMIVIWATALYGLKWVANLKPGESVLIHAAAGGVGQAAIQYAQMVGAEVFATVSTVEKKTLLMDEYGIKAERIFFSRDLAFVTGITRLAPQGVDVILNSMAGEALQETWGCLAPFGRFIEIGKRDILSGGKLPMSPFHDNRTFAGVNLVALARLRPKVVRELLQEVMQLWQEEKIHPPKPITVVPYGQIQAALRTLQTGSNMGKIVCIPQAEDTIPYIEERPAPYRLDPTAVYILAGGMGGLGRSIAHWMATRGARHLVFLSRSNKLHPAGETMVSTLEAMGCRVQVICCDIFDGARVKTVFEDIQGPTGARIRGCIICSLSLADSSFNEMSHRQWQEPLQAKVQGSWNIHRYLSSDHLQFFVMLSSIAGVVGNRGQANYNAGNVFQDTLAELRVSQGLPAMSINLSAVASVGYIAERKESLRHMLKAFTTHSADEMLAILEYALDPRRPPSLATCQLVCGLVTQSAYEQRGIPAPRPLHDPLFVHLRDRSVPADTAKAADGASGQYCMQALLATAQSDEAAAQVVLTGIQKKLSSVLSIAEGEVDPSRSVRENGVDSLIEMEFRTWVSRELEMRLEKADLSGKTLSELSVEAGTVDDLQASSSSVKFRGQVSGKLKRKQCHSLVLQAIAASN